jgi:hypothetical protein
MLLEHFRVVDCISSRLTLVSALVKDTARVVVQIPVRWSEIEMDAWVIKFNSEWNVQSPPEPFRLDAKDLSKHNFDLEQ